MMTSIQKSNVSGIIIHVQESGDLLCRVRDLGMVFLPRKLLAGSLGVGQWLALDVEWRPGQSGRNGGAGWVGTRLRRRLLPAFPNLESTGPTKNSLIIHDVPAVLTTVVSDGNTGFLYSELLGRIQMWTMNTKGFDPRGMHPMDILSVSVKPVMDNKNDYAWTAVKIGIPERRDRADFPSMREFHTSHPPSKLDRGYGFLVVPELGGSVFFSYNDCLEPLRGQKMVEALRRARGFHGYAVPVIHGKGAGPYRAVFLRPADFPPQTTQDSSALLQPHTTSRKNQEKCDTISVVGGSSIAGEMESDQMLLRGRTPPTSPGLSLSPSLTDSTDLSVSTPLPHTPNLDSSAFPDPRLVGGSEWREMEYSGIHPSGRSLIGSDFDLETHEEDSLREHSPPFSHTDRRERAECREYCENPRTWKRDGGIGHASTWDTEDLEDVESTTSEEDEALIIREFREEKKEVAEVPLSPHIHPPDTPHPQDSDTHEHLLPPRQKGPVGEVPQKEPGVEAETQTSGWSESELVSRILRDGALMDLIIRRRPDVVGMLADLIIQELEVFGL